MKKNLKKMWPYIQIARFDHWIKNIFVIPGFLCGCFIGDVHADEMWEITQNLILGLFIVGMIASSNYIINEYLDREFDRQHPVKKNRAAANNKVKGRVVFVEYVAFLAIGIGLASIIGGYFLVFSIVLAVMGLLYNVEPIRTKDKPYVDVLSESLNNPLRFLLGWFVVQQNFMPPSSVLLAYWMGGAYLMTVKRYSELRQINDKTIAASYRKSFAYYNDKRLLVSAVFYATLSMLFLGIFLIKYKIEYIISAPFLALLFSWYLDIGFNHDSAAVAPEKLYKETAFMIYVGFLVLLFVALTFIHIPALEMLTYPVSIH